MHKDIQQHVPFPCPAAVLSISQCVIACLAIQCASESSLLRRAFLKELYLNQTAQEGCVELVIPCIAAVRTVQCELI